VLTHGAGLFAAGALVFTAQNFVLTRRTVELLRRTLDLTEQGQVTDRYTKAIEQLGSDRPDVWIGGIYALERVARRVVRNRVVEKTAAATRSTECTGCGQPGFRQGRGEQGDGGEGSRAYVTRVGECKL
jgi:hypothetical protein